MHKRTAEQKLRAEEFRATQFVHCLDDLKMRVAYKEEREIPLDPVEEHLSKNLKPLSRGVFAPLAWKTGLEFSGFLLKIFLLALGPILVFALLYAAPPTQLEIEEQLEKFLPKRVSRILITLISKRDFTEIDPQFASNPLEEKGLLVGDGELYSETYGGSGKDGEIEGARVAVEALKSTANPTARADLVNFISGMISIYYPASSDPGRIARAIVEISTTLKADPMYIASIISVESGFFPKARSRVGARGLMQLMPATAAELARGKKFSITDPETNIRMGVTYIRYLERRYRGNRHYALAAYNWGLANVDAVIRGEKTMPSSVNRYGLTILQRTIRWRKQLAKSRASARLLERRLTTANDLK